MLVTGEPKEPCLVKELVIGILVVAIRRLIVILCVVVAESWEQGNIIEVFLKEGRDLLVRVLKQLIPLCSCLLSDILIPL